MSETIKVHFKLSGGQQYSLDVAPESSAKEVKEKLASQIDIPADTQRLVFKGRIIKDADTLAAMKVTNNCTMHVLRTGVPPAETASAAPAPPAAPESTAMPNPPPPAAAANPFASLGGFNPAMFGAGGGMGGLPGLDPSSIGQMLQNPMMQQMMQNMMQNPDMLRAMVQSNPTLQNLVASNPMVRETLENPEMLSSMFSPDALNAASALYGAQGAGAQGAGAPAPAPAMPDLAGMMAALGQNVGQAPPTGTANSAPPDMYSNLNRMMQDPAFQSVMASMGGTHPGANANPLAGLEGLLGGRPNASPADSRPAIERFAEQIRQLEDMGFLDRDANLGVLQQTNGDVNAAINVLLERGFGN